MRDLKEGDIFKAFNSDMTPPKVKYHFCINKNKFFIINSEPRNQGFNFKLSIQDCRILTKECYVHYGKMVCRPIEDFNIIDKAELSKKALDNLIEHIKIVPTFTNNQKKEIIKSLKEAL